MSSFEPGDTLFRRYRLERLLVAQAGVTVWEATDLHYERRVQLSLFEDGSTMLDHGRIDGGNFVVIDPPRGARLELVETSEEDDFFGEPFAFPPPRRTRTWRWAVAGLACGLAVGGAWFWHARPAVSETTITSAPIIVPQRPQPSAIPSDIPSAEPERHETPPPPLPKPKRPKPKSWAEEPIRF